MFYPDFSPLSTALLLVDLQNDFFFKKGAYPRAGLAVPEGPELLDRLAQVAAALRRAGGWVVSTHFTLLPGRDGEPLISPSLRQARPFLAKGDFAPGSFGHRLVEELAPADFQIDKIAPSAFYQSFLDHVLRASGISTLVIGGVVTNSGVAATLRDAQNYGYQTVLLTDGCAAFSPEAHQHMVQALQHVTPALTCEQAVDVLEGYK
ncbi:MAG: cysteine hydrolase [Bernardetiaceae bacterium]|jgi:nicotinamidase-related amidase|nr:cysteine hydrolase [Bernardetiaceae bacterium]